MEDTHRWIAPEYYRSYIDRAGEADTITALENNLEESLIVFQLIPEEKASYTYSEDKWSIQEMVQHLVDTERVFAYRALRIGRGDETVLPGFEQDDFVRESRNPEHLLSTLLKEFKIVRQSTIFLFKSFPELAWEHIGNASGGQFNLEGIGRTIVGHTRHHLRILERRYL
jgi:hypothetical protein